MYYIYIIKSQKTLDKYYVGYTLNLASRLENHNTGGSIYTANDRPWKLVWCCAFKDKMKAIEFEQYLKSHSGRAFMGKRLT